MLTRKSQLKHLIDSLYEIILILLLDSGCRWSRIFVNLLKEAENLYYNDFTDSEIDSIAVSVMDIYCGVKSFKDYTPVKYDTENGCFIPIPGACNFQYVSDSLFESARDLCPSRIDMLLTLVK